MVLERLKEYIDLKGVTVAAFERSIGMSNASFGKSLKQGKGIGSDKLEKILSVYPDINPSWLLTGAGEILLTKTPKNVLKQNEDKFEDINEDKRKLQKTSSNDNTETVVVDNVFKLRTDRLIDRQQIPIYDMEAVAGLVPLFADQYSQSIVEVMETTLIPKCDGGLRIVGDSMYPLLKSGDIVFYKQVHDIMHSIIWGEMYLISFDIDGDEYVSVKYLQKSDIPDHIVLVSYNEHHKPMEIHINRIRALAFIKASLRLNSLK
jgi:phage repressor protein C with HTH and peptisase S24 domain